MQILRGRGEGKRVVILDLRALMMVDGTGQAPMEF